ncbi:MAG: hypothetical protein HQ567_08570 [Candidatus Nealsonbacteria bacterium]|nr:hypothetical protein [Candidatus Nealsonbacteria bacterium]
MIQDAGAHFLSHPAALLAAGNYGRSGGGEMIAYLGVAVVAIAVVCVGAYLASRLVHQRRFNNDGTLFSGLCAVHALDRSARRLLVEVAGHRRLSQRARLFTDPRWLDPATLRGPIRRRANEVDALRRRLFS